MREVFGHFTTILEEDFRGLSKIPEDFRRFQDALVFRRDLGHSHNFFYGLITDIFVVVVVVVVVNFTSNATARFLAVIRPMVNLIETLIQVM